MSKVLVLMSTYNGEKYICEQLDSIINQTFQNIDILVRDDGSRDKTQEILEKYKIDNKLDWYTGDNLKPAKSFMDLVYNCDNSYDYYAFCDQDDFWLEDKISRAVDLLSRSDKPAMYYCATNNVDSHLNHIDNYFRNSKASKSLKSSIKAGSLIPGCTMVFNRELLNFIRLYKPEYIGMHDNWVHLICLAVHGDVISDENALILYRQHTNNAVGSGKKSINYRLCRLFGNPNIYSRIAFELYKGYKQFLTADENEFLQNIINYKKNVRSTLECLKDSTFNGISVKDRLIYKLKIVMNLY